MAVVRPSIPIASRNSFELERDEPRSNEGQRSEPHPQPQHDAEKQRPPSHLFHRGPGHCAANQEKRRGEAESAKREQPIPKVRERRKRGIATSSPHKQA